jgi:hypothetical protein
VKIRPNLIAAILVLSLGYALFPGKAVSFTAFPKAEGLDVASVFSDPFAYKGEIKVRGAVMDAGPAKNRFNIIDYREYRACRAIDCAKEWITIVFAGNPPAVASVVEVTGVIEKNAAGKGGFVLKAKAVTVK